MLLGGQSLIVRATSTAAVCRGVTEVIVVAPAGHRIEMQDALHALSVPEPVRLRVVDGGSERTDSVAAGLAALSAEVGIVLVHDAARALTPVEVFDEVIHAVRSGHSAVIPVVPVTDTIKEVAAYPNSAYENSAYKDSGRPVMTSGDVVLRTVERTNLRAAQTPQGFLRETLVHAHSHFGAGASTHGAASATDDAGMVEALGGTVFVVAGDHRSMKITTPHDLAVAEVMLAGAP